MIRPGHPEEGTPSQLREYFAVFRLRKWWIVGVSMVVVGTAVMLSIRQTPLYTSRAKVLVEAVNLSPEQAGGAPVPNIETEKQLVDSITVARAVTKELRLTTSPEELLKHLGVDAPTGTEILDITYTDPVPGRAQRLAQAFAAQYLALRHGRFVTALKAVSDPVKQRTAALSEQLRAVNLKLTVTRSPSKRTTLQDQASSLVAQIAILQQRLADLPGEDSLTVGQIEDPADLPDSSANRGVLVNTGLGLFLGLAAGVGVALVRDRLDDRLRSTAEFEAASGVPLLAMIPRSKELGADPLPVVLLPPASLVADAFRMLRAGILFTLSHHGARTVLVTSPSPGEGKTTVAAHLGRALAHADKRVVLMSADLRRPRLPALFGDTSELGLSDALMGSVGAREALVRTETPNLMLLPPGIVRSNQIELLGLDPMIRLLQELAEACDIVLVDAPPVLDVPDALALAGCVDGVLLVADASSTTKDALAGARRKLDLVGAPVLGGVLNYYNPSQFRAYQRPAAYYRYEPVRHDGEAVVAELPRVVKRNA